MVSDAPSSLWGLFSVPSWGSLSVSLSPRASLPLLVSPAFLLVGLRASSLGYEGFFSVNVLLCFSEHLSHACLRIL